MAYNVVEPPMKRRFFAGPPKVTLETWCGTNIRPSNSPRELMQWTPSAALLQMLPYSSTRIPSQYPGSTLWKISPPDSVAPSGPRLKTRIYCRGKGSVWFPVSAMYNRVSSCEKASPLGPSKSFATTLMSPVSGRPPAVVLTPAVLLHSRSRCHRADR